MVVQAPERPPGMPREGVLALHDRREIYADFEAFQPRLISLLQEGGLLQEVITVTQALGILEPFTGEHIPPEALQIQPPNYRESVIGNGLLRCWSSWLARWSGWRRWMCIWWKHSPALRCGCDGTWARTA